jgi:hypothetical protein
MHEKLFVVAEPMKFVQDGEVLGFVGIERGGKHDTIRNAARKDFAGDGIALDAAGGDGARDAKDVEEGKEVKEKGRTVKAGTSLRSG